MSKPTKSGPRRRPSPPASGERVGPSRAGKVRIVFVGAILLVAACGALVLVLFPGAFGEPRTQGLGDAQPDGPPPPPPKAVAADDLRARREALRKETFDAVRQLMADFPRSSDPIGLMAMLHGQYGNSAEATNWWRKCLQRDPTRVDVYLALGLIAMKNGEYHKTLDLLGKARDIDPNLPGVHGRCAEALLALGKPDEALAALAREIKVSPGTRINDVLLARAHLQKKEYAKARDAYARVAEMQPGESIEYYKLVTTAYYGLTTSCTRLGQSDKAGEYMEKFKKLQAEESRLVALQRTAAYKRVYEAQVLARTLTDAGRVYSGHREFLKAEKHWLRAAEIAPSDTACRQQLANLYSRSGRPRKSLEMCEQLMELAPKNVSHALMRGFLLARLKRFDAAEEAMRRVIDLAPMRAVGYRSLARFLLLRNKKLPEAAAAARKVVELEPTADHYSLLGEACHRNGDHAGALAAAKRAAELALNNSAVR